MTSHPRRRRTGRVRSFDPQTERDPKCEGCGLRLTIEEDKASRGRACASCFEKLKRKS